MRKEVHQNNLAGTTAYINAGGEGSRLKTAVTGDPIRGISKALLEFGDPKEAILKHQLDWLSKEGATILVAAAGHHYNVGKILDSEPGYQSNIYPVYIEKQLGTGGDLLLAIQQRPELFAETVLISNVDTIADIDLGKFLRFHRQKHGAMTIALTLSEKMSNGDEIPNIGAYYVDSDGKVIFCAETDQNPISQEEAEELSVYRGSSTGIIAAQKTFLETMDWLPQDGPISIYKDLVAKAVMEGAMRAFNNQHRSFIDIGTPAAMKYAESHPELFSR